MEGEGLICGRSLGYDTDRCAFLLRDDALRERDREVIRLLRFFDFFPANVEDSSCEL